MDNPDQAGRRPGRGFVVVAATCGALFLTITLLVELHGRPALDLEVARWTAAHRSRFGTDLFDVISYAGSVIGIIPASIVLSVYLYRRSGWASVRWLWIAVGGATVIYLATNLSFAVPRPPVELRALHETGWSFPSGHSTQTVAFWIVTAVLLSVGRPRWVARMFGALAVVMILLTGASRIYLDAHFPTDVAAGFSLGGMWCALVLAMRAAREV